MDARGNNWVCPRLSLNCASGFLVIFITGRPIFNLSQCITIPCFKIKLFFSKTVIKGGRAQIPI